MALRIAIPSLPKEQEQTPTEQSTVMEARLRRLKLASYVDIDPAIRFVIALAIVAAISLLYLVQASNVAEINYRVQRLDTEKTQLAQKRQQLQLDIAKAQALDRIEQVATNDLKMVPVGDDFSYLNIPSAAAATPAPINSPAQTTP